MLNTSYTQYPKKNNSLFKFCGYLMGHTKKDIFNSSGFLGET